MESYLIYLIGFPLLGGLLMRLWFIDEGDIFNDTTFIILGKDMTKLLELLKKAWNWKPLRVFIWNCFNALMAYIGGLLIAPDYAIYAVFLTPLLTTITKYINTKWFNDLGVYKEI